MELVRRCSVAKQYWDGDLAYVVQPSPSKRTLVLTRAPMKSAKSRSLAWCSLSLSRPAARVGDRHLHGETIQRRVLFRDTLMKILALKVGEVRR